MLTTCDGSRGLQRRQERAQAPDAAEVVRPHDLLDALRLRREEVAARTDSRVVDEQLDRGMPLAHARGRGVHGLAVGDVARLGLAADLAGELPQLFLAPREQDAMPAVGGEPPCDRGSDAARGAGDYRNGYEQTRTVRLAEKVRPPASRTVACSTCLPLRAPFVLPVLRVQALETGLDRPQLLLPVEERDRGDLLRRARDDEQALGLRGARVA